jgi:CRISPR system Cascade subunit CasC
MFIELHFIQNFAPSSLNRDDANMPKDCMFGGVRRARISSQCLKRAIRLHPDFSRYSGVPASERTYLLVKSLTMRLVAAGKPPDEAQNSAEQFSRYYSSKKGRLNGQQTAVMLFVSEAEIEEIVQRLLESETWENTKAIKSLAEKFAKETKKRSSAPDIAMFGRMLVDRPDTNVDAACQVAHAISTHRVSMEVDFFSAIDDLNTARAGMMGTIGYNSACYYRYALIDFGQLQDNLGNDLALARLTTEAFLRASVKAIPGGKQNSFAAQNFPSFLMAVLRNDGMCWSLANAFAQPVVSQPDLNLIAASVQALDFHWGEMNVLYGGDACPVVCMLGDAPELGFLADARVKTLEDWIKNIMEEIPLE